MSMNETMAFISQFPKSESERLVSRCTKNDLIRLGDMTHTSYHNTRGHCYDTQGVSQYSLANKLSAKEKLFFSYFNV